MVRSFSGVCVLISFMLGACANIDSIDRTTYLEDKKAKAIHLDAKQRLLIVNNMGRYCAEPAPDALSAFAASLGLGASAPGTGAASLSGANKSDVASIGLRTQSITLMRDALYRMCEAYGNGAIGEAQVVTLLNRSQDLTAVILATEQLTGAVAASQVALSGTAGSSANAIALNSSKLLAQASDDEARALDRLSTAKGEESKAKESQVAAQKTFDDKKKLRDGLSTKRDAEQAGLDALSKAVPPDAAKVADAQAALAKTKVLLAEAERDATSAEGVRDRADAALKTETDRVGIYQTAYLKAQEVTAEIAKTPNTASSATTATTGGSSRFGAVQRSKELSKEATQAVAQAVTTMVVEVLKKDYVLDSCMSVITSNRGPRDGTSLMQEAETRAYCRGLVDKLVIKKSIETEIEIEKSKMALITARVASDTGREKALASCLAVPENRVAFLGAVPDALKAQGQWFTAERFETIRDAASVMRWWRTLADAQRDRAWELSRPIC